MSHTIFKKTILYAEFLARKDSIEQVGIEEFKEALSETYPYISVTDPFKNNIEKLLVNLDLLNLKEKEPESRGYIKISKLTDSTKNNIRLNFTDELFDIMQKIELDIDSLDADLRAIFVKIPIFGFDTAKLIKKTLKQNIFGQDRAIDIISDAFKDDLLKKKNMPKNIFFFLGSSGTGKTFLANSITSLLPEYSFKSFDMTQYSHPEIGGNLVGTPRMWGNAKNGELTSYVKKHPKSVIVFDEFDKAHTNVQNALLTLLNDGYIDDANGWCADGEPWHKDRGNEAECSDKNLITRVNFNETILIFTTNLGSKLYNDDNFMEAFTNNYIQSQQILYDVLAKETTTQSISAGFSKQTEAPAILPHFLSRLMQAKLVLFNKLTLEHFLKIIKIKFEEFKLNILKSYDIDVVCNNDNLKYLFNFLVLQQAPNIDARNVNTKSIQNLYHDILEHIEVLDIDFSFIDTIKLDISKDAKIYFEENFSEMIQNNNLIKYFFRKNISFIFSSKVDIEDKTLIYTIKSISHNKINSVYDFQGSDALSFEVPDITFDQIAGHNKVKEKLKEIIKYLKDPKLTQKYGIEIPRGMLMYGKPGTGKTLLAKAFANEADLPIIQTTGAKLLNQEHLTNIYKKAKEYAPCIIFIDEIDTLGKRDGNTFKDTIINQLLTELNGFNDDNESLIFTMAATNLKYKIDDAILRSGRIDIHLEIDDLDQEARKYFMNKLKSKPTQKDIDIDKLVFYTAGMTGADLEKVLRESSLEALRTKNNIITQQIVIEQINIIKYGQRTILKSIESVLNETAYHEAGHAVIFKVLMPHIPIEQITIIPRGESLGFVSYNDEDIESNMSKKDIENKIAILFAGRIAQTKQFNDDGFDTGASNDLEKATFYAYIMAAGYGMDEKLGYLNISRIKNNTFLQSQIEESVIKTLKTIQIKAEELVDKHWEKIEKIAKLLIEKEVLEFDELREVL